MLGYESNKIYAECVENYKLQMKEDKEGLHKWKDSSY